MSTDEKLIQQIKQGESKAFGQLFSKYKNRIYSICLNIVKNPHDAEEVVQDTFIHAYLKIDQLKEPDRSNSAFPYQLQRPDFIVFGKKLRLM